MVDLSRRGLFRGRIRPVATQQRMPWVISEEIFTQHCTRCDDCLRKCPEQIIQRGDGGFPSVDFSRGECTFCGSCAEVCQAPVFTEQSQPPWQQLAVVSETCLTFEGVSCRSCEEGCEPEAITFRPQRGGISKPEIISDLCNGCGGCISSCPTNAIQIKRSLEAGYE